MANDAQGKRRAASNAFILAFLGFQIAMPLRYYLGGRGDDERFSWRMFSSVRMQRCQVKVHEVVGGARREVDLGQAVQIAWIGMLERNRPQVVKQLLAQRCRDAKASATQYERKCTDTDGSALRALELQMNCARGTVEPRRGQP